MHRSIILLIVIIITSNQFPSFAENIKSDNGNQTEEKFRRFTIEYELDAYYSSLGLYINLWDEPIKDAGKKKELLIYRDLLLDSYIPRFIVLESSIFPMPCLGVIHKEHGRNSYDKADLNGFNIVKAITSGFEEPYAFSLFIGNVVKFTEKGAEEKQGNLGYMGYLFSYGNYHIKDNELVDDKWYEMEWKIKGDRIFSSHRLSWSFRVGLKLHDNAEIKDIIYFSMRRSRLDFELISNSIFFNSGFQYTIDLDKDTLKPLRHYFTIDRKWPWREKKLGASLAIGFIWENKKRYTGELSNIDDNRNYQIIVRPNIHF